MASDLIDHNPALKAPVLLALAVCGEMPGQSRVRIEEELAARWQPAFRQAPASVVDALVRAGYLNEEITVAGEPYAGTLEDAYGDESIPEDAEIDALLSVTAEGGRVAADYAPEATLAALKGDRPAYLPVFGAVVSACATEGGATRAELEELVEQVVERQGIAAADGGKVFPQYFLDALETAGGIVWDGAWRATEAGRASLL